MAITPKPNVNRPWATTGVKVEPAPEKQDVGWIVERPPYQYQNYLQNRNDTFLKHINEAGIPLWDSSTAYTAGKSYVQGSDGLIYVALLNTTGNDPVSSATQWTRAILTPTESEAMRVEIQGYRNESEDFAADAEQSAIEAAASAALAGTRADASSASAVAAANSALAASNSQTAAGNSQTAAASSQSAAAAAATAASNSQTAAANSRDAAAGSATTASAAATTATTGATTATTKAAEAVTSANNAASARDAANSARDAAAGSATSAAASAATAQQVIAPGTLAQYWRGDKTWQDFGNSVRNSLLTGLTTVSAATIAATDTVLIALAKLQASIGTKVSKSGDTMTGDLLIMKQNAGLLLRETGQQGVLFATTRTDPLVVQRLGPNGEFFDTPLSVGLTGVLGAPANHSGLAVSDNGPAIATTSWIRRSMQNIANAAGFAFEVNGQQGYLKFPSWLGGRIEQWGSDAVTTDSNGTVSLNYPITFPSQVFSRLACNGDGASGNLKMDIWVEGQWAGARTGIAFRVWGPDGTPVANNTVRINWRATGY